MKCPKCNSQMNHCHFWDEGEWLDDEGNVNYFHDSYDYWQCTNMDCYNRIGDWEDEYVYPEDLEE